MYLLLRNYYQQSTFKGKVRRDLQSGSQNQQVPAQNHFLTAGWHRGFFKMWNLMAIKKRNGRHQSFKEERNKDRPLINKSLRREMWSVPCFQPDRIPSRLWNPSVGLAVGYVFSLKGAPTLESLYWRARNLTGSHSTREGKEDKIVTATSSSTY